MSAKLTVIKLRGQREWSGTSDWGEQSTADMIKQARDQASWLRAQADLIDQAADADFRITVVRGSLVQHHLKTLQEGRAA